MTEDRQKQPKNTESPPEGGDQFIVPREVIESLPEDIRNSVIMAAYSGPLPPPEMFKGYEDALRGSADRILTMTERQSENRMGLEQTMVHATVRSTWVGQLFGHTYSILALVAATFVAVNGHPGISIIFLGTGVAGYIRDAFRFLRDLTAAKSGDST